MSVLILSRQTVSTIAGNPLASLVQPRTLYRLSVGPAGLVILWSVVQSSALCLAVAAGLIDRTAATLFIFDGSTP